MVTSFQLVSLLTGLTSIRRLLRRTPDRVNVFAAFGPKGVSGQGYGRNWAITSLDRPADDRLFWFAWNCAGRLCGASEDREAGYCGRAVFVVRHFDNLFTEVALLVTRGK